MEANHCGVFYPDEAGQICDYVLDQEAQTCTSHRGGSPPAKHVEGIERGVSPTNKRTSPRREGKYLRNDLKLFEVDARRCSLLIMLVCVFLIIYQFFVYIYIVNYMNPRCFSIELNSLQGNNISDIVEGALINHGSKKSTQDDLDNSTQPNQVIIVSDLKKFAAQSAHINQSKNKENMEDTTKSFHNLAESNSIMNPELNKPSTDSLEASSGLVTSSSSYNPPGQCLHPNQSLPSCPSIPARLVGRIKVDLTTPSWSEVAKECEGVRAGGEFSPTGCVAKEKVAVIVPYRNRPDQLKTFLRHLHPILMRQDIHYQIFIVNQSGNNTFNRAMLFNAGVVEASKLCDWDCFVFHDVDLLPEDDRNLYTCPEQPRHLSVAVSTMNYKLPYEAIFGGASVLTAAHFKLVNGFSNQFWGWGGEDDNMSDRIRHHGLKITRYKDDIARYTMIPHEHEASNKANPSRWKLLKDGKKYHDKDGLNNLQYKLISRELEDFYTNITVIIDKVNVANGKS